MPHQRPRDLLKILIKRIKLWPVVGVIGPRQCGKSVLLRDLFLEKIKGQYITLDSIRDRTRAQSSPEAFSQPLDHRQTLILDEVQKAPHLFDSIKLHVDQNRKPGMYVISGSTEFSKLTGIRESLTGRVGILHLYPLTLSELYEKKTGGYWIQPKPVQACISLKDFDLKLDRGGMPGFCFLRNQNEFNLTCEAWLSTTCYRDLQQVVSKGLDGGLALAILGALSQTTDPTVTQISKQVKKDPRVVQRFLDALEAILVIKKLIPHSAGIGKPHYLMCDVGLATYLGANRETQIRTHLMTEALAAFEYSGLGKPLLQYYRNAKTSRIPLVFKWLSPTKSSPKSMAIQYYDGENPNSKDWAALNAFSKRTEEKMRLILLTQTQKSYQEGSIEVHPLRG